MLEIGLANELLHFEVHLGQLEAAADFVADVIRENYPDLDVPLHARWRHFVADGRDLWAGIDAQVNWPDAPSRARSMFDLAIVSVLLDAGAGSDWIYRDAVTGLECGRSEGLALASLRMFEAGLFSSDPQVPLRADAAALANLTSAKLAQGFQVTGTTPLKGLEGRAALIGRLGHAISGNTKVFASSDSARPGGLFDYLTALASNNTIPATAVLEAVLLHLGPIWPGRITVGGLSLGDTWRHSAMKRAGETNQLVPLHKLSQWLSYSLIEPLQDAGIAVSGIDGLTGLAEYRNGGLFIDLGVIALKCGDEVSPHAVDSELVVEWRALTVALLDRLAPLVRERLDVTAEAFPLGCVLEGGTWAAGRKIARMKRADGGQPLKVISDGTVF